MAYNDTPLPTETPAQSQPLMRQNFQQIATSYNTDHIPLTSVATVGFSNKLTLVDQSTNPSGLPGGVAGSDVLYANTVGSLIELFLQRQAGGPVQLTSGIPISGGNGSTFLPGGIILKWGAKQPGQTGSSFPISFTTLGIGNFPNSMFGAIASSNNSARDFFTGAYAPTGFTVQLLAGGPLGAPDNFFWIALGN